MKFVKFAYVWFFVVRRLYRLFFVEKIMKNILFSLGICVALQGTSIRLGALEQFDKESRSVFVAENIFDDQLTSKNCQKKQNCMHTRHSKGPKGPVGPTGATGATGPAGPSFNQLVSASSTYANILYTGQYLAMDTPDTIVGFITPDPGNGFQTVEDGIFAITGYFYSATTTDTLVLQVGASTSYTLAAQIPYTVVLSIPADTFISIQGPASGSTTTALDSAGRSGFLAIYQINQPVP